MLENIGNAITRLPMDRLGQNMGGLIPSSSRHVQHDAVAMATAVAWQRRIEHSAVMGVWRPNAWTNCDETCTVASNQHLYRKTVWLVLVVTANRTVNVLVLGGVEIKNIHNFDETWMTVPLWYKKIKPGIKQQILIQKNLRSFITVKAHCSTTHLKQQTSFVFF